METFRLQITEEMEEERVDKCVSELMDSKISRSFLQKIIKDGKLLVNGAPVKVSHKVHADDEVEFTIPDLIQPDIEAENIPLDILYEDEALLIVNKPKGMVVHPAAGHYSNTLVNALMYHCRGQLSGINGIMRPGIVHRIDMDTSGSIVVCKNDTAHNGLAAQFKEHSITRKYYAICCGTLGAEEGTVDKPLMRHPVERKKMCIAQRPGEGKRAVTHYKVLERLGKYTYIECRLETGRTHQIRVHMAGIGHPLLGDMVYGKQDYKGLGQMLHAKTLGFVHPITGEYLEVEAPIPDYFLDCLQKYR